MLLRWNKTGINCKLRVTSQPAFRAHQEAWISHKKLPFPPYLCPRLYRLSEGEPKIFNSGYQVFQGNLFVLVRTHAANPSI